MNLDETVFRSHVSNGNFLDGASRNKWNLICIDWPHVWISVSALAREGLLDKYVFRFDCSNYPQNAPTSVPWDMELNRALEPDLWPAGTGPVARVFNPGWNLNALYFGMDRQALGVHPNWVEDFPKTTWNPRKEITHYLGQIYVYLNSPHYQGTRRSIRNRG